LGISSEKIPYLEEKLLVNFDEYLEFSFDKIKTLARDILNLFEESMKEKRNLIFNSEKYLIAVNPKRNLKLGYSIVFNQKNKVIKDINQIGIDEILTTKLHKGEFLSKVKKIKKSIKND